MSDIRHVPTGEIQEYFPRHPKLCAFTRMEAKTRFINGEQQHQLMFLTRWQGLTLTNECHSDMHTHVFQVLGTDYRTIWFVRASFPLS